ncbi:MAG: acyl-CoA dehydrogenase family protein [Dehalococcoidia bacterium]|nr:acyl-CoA dehydrogenase family protein [Dehalococcoidia bacterium]
MARDYAADILDPVAQQIVSNVGTWVDREVKPVASEFEHADQYPDALVKGMSEMGLFGIKIPEQYGGLDFDLRMLRGVCMELARGWMSLAGSSIRTSSSATQSANTGLRHRSRSTCRGWWSRRFAAP